MTSVRISIEVILQAENSRRRLLHNNVFRQLQCGWSECCSLSVLLTCTPIAPDSLGKQFKFKKILKINFLTDWSQMTDIWLMPCGRSQSGSGITRSLFSTNSSSQLCTIRSISGCALCAPLLKGCDSLRILQWGRSSALSQICEDLKLRFFRITLETTWLNLSNQMIG